MESSAIHLPFTIEMLKLPMSQMKTRTVLNLDARLVPSSLTFQREKGSSYFSGEFKQLSLNGLLKKSGNM